MTEVEIVKKLIEIPSQIEINTEKEVASYLIKLLSKYNFKIDTYEFQKDRPNIIATYNFDKKGPTVIFNGHMDTMPYINGENNWNYPPEKATEIDEKIYGRGACDMKGGIACALSAIFKVIDNNLGRGKIVVNLVCDEENTSLYGMVPICEKKLLKGDIAIVMEPTECVPCPMQLGNMFFKSFVQGDGGHTGLPEGKTNSFDLAFKYIEQLKEWVETKRINKSDSQPFINIGRFEGGTSSGTIPSECTLFWGTRVMPHDNFDSYRKEIELLTEEFNDRLPKNCQIKTTLFEGGGIDSFACNSNLIDQFLKHCKREKGVFPASSDAGFISNISKINSVIYGPGSLKQAHKSNEFVSLSDLHECTDVLYDYLINVGENYD